MVFSCYLLMWLPSVLFANLAPTRRIHKYSLLIITIVISRRPGLTRTRTLVKINLAEHWLIGGIFREILQNVPAIPEFSLIGSPRFCTELVPENLIITIFRRTRCF